MVEQVTVIPPKPYSILYHLKMLSLPNRHLPTFYDGNRCFWRILTWRGEKIAYKVEVISEGFNPKLKVYGYLGSLNTILNALSYILRFDLDLSPYLTDKILGKLIRKYGGLRPPRTPTLFEALITSIIRQQINVNLATRLISNLVTNYGDKLVIHDLTFYDFPAPEILAERRIDELRKIGLSKRKAEYIIKISRAIRDGFDIEGIKELPINKAIKELMKFKGVGTWTAELSYVVATGDLSWAPFDDLAVVRGVSLYLGKEVNGKYIRELFKDHPLRGLIIYYLSFLYEEKYKGIKPS